LKLSFHGADRSVTGSCHLVECAGKRILIDCGLHQGSRELDEENAGPFGFDAAGINYVLLTHAHLDHCGRLPLLAKRGFRGEIITTSASRELARLIMLDSAHQQEDLAAALQEPPEDGGLWSGPKVAQWMQRTLGREIAPQRGWDYLQRVGYSSRVPRPQHAKADAEVQQAFKKTARAGRGRTSRTSASDHRTVEHG